MKNSSIVKRLPSRSVQLICLTLFASALLFACKKPSTSTDPEPIPPNRHGEVIGTPTVQKIGVDGGTVTTPDANIKLVIPAGALKGDVNISVQEVESTLGSITVGKTYRLLPENIQFEKDVDLTINYTSDDLNGTRKELLYLAYQNAKGDWYTASKTTYDPNNNRVSVKTRHFSDWTAYAYAKMTVSGKDELLVKETTKFSVEYVEPPAESEIDALLGPVVKGIVRQWSPINDPAWGKLVTDGDNATYSAPDVHKNFGHDIVAYIDLNKFRTGPGRPLPPSAYFVSHFVVLLPDEYVRRGKLDFFDTIDKSFKNGELYLIARAGTAPNYNRSLYIFNSKQAVGNYMFGKFEDTYVRYFSYGFNYNSIYTCKSEEKYSLGSIMITKNENGYIEGKIGGNVQYTGAPCDPSQNETVSGSFRVRKE